MCLRVKGNPGLGGCKKGGDIGTVGDGEDVLSGNLSHLSLVKGNLPLGFLFFFGLQIACTFSKQGTNIIILNALSLALVIGITRYGGNKGRKRSVLLNRNIFISDCFYYPYLGQHICIYHDCSIRI